MGMKIIVTGGAGFIGQHLVKRLVKDGHKVTIIDDLSSASFPYSVPDNVVWITKNILNVKQIDTDVDVIYHLASLSTVPACENNKELAFMTNIVATEHMMKLAGRACKRFIFPSTSVVYKHSTHKSVEADDTAPDSAYALTKLIGELILDKELYPTILRLSNVYGPGDSLSHGHVIPAFINAIRLDEPLKVFGNVIRNYVYIDDVIDAMILAMELPSGVYNVGSNESESTRELANLVCCLSGKPNHRIDFEPPRIGDISYVDLDIARIKSYGYSPKYTIRTGIRAMIKSEGAHNERTVESGAGVGSRVVEN